MKTIQIFDYEGKQVKFDLSKLNMMVNATEMASIYGKEVAHFMANDGTKKFINSCLKTRNSEFLGIQKESDLYLSKQRSGTWMHRVLALKFAAWLDPDFEVWVYYTIDKIMFGTMREDALKKAKSESEKERLHQKLLRENTDYVLMINSDENAKEIGKRIKKQQRTQLSLMLEDNNN
jgi:hypothetical protein